MYLKEFTDKDPIKRQALEGYIANAVSDIDDELFVHLPQFDEESTTPRAKHGPVKGWNTRDGNFPTIGDHACVTIGDQSSIYMIGWHPVD